MEQTEDQPNKLTFAGWGPCFHSEEERRQVDEWIDSLRELTGIPAGKYDTAEWLLWEIVDLGGTPKMYADQWVGVSTEGKFFVDDGENVPYEIWVESDSFIAALAATFAWLLWKATEVGSWMSPWVKKNHGTEGKQD